MKSINLYFEELKYKLKELGVVEGDILYIASDISVFLYQAYRDFEINGIAKTNVVLDMFIETLQCTVGKNGTIMFPVFSWEFCKGKEFDYLKTKGKVGALSNFVLESRKDFLRTAHPIYSFMVWGKYQEELVNMSNQDAWGEASPFGFMRKKKAKQLLFDIEAYQGFTFGHYVEQCLSVPYRYPKYFFGNYKDKDGIDEIRMYSMYVRELEVDCEICVTNAFLLEKNVAVQTCCYNNCLTVIDLTAAYDVVADDMKNNAGKNVLRFDHGMLDWNAKKKHEYEIGNVPLNLVEKKV